MIKPTLGLAALLLVGGCVMRPTQQANMQDMREKRRARLERARADLEGQRRLPADDVSAKELTPIRIYLRGLEIVGKAVVRPFDPRGKS